MAKTPTLSDADPYYYINPYYCWGFAEVNEYEIRSYELKSYELKKCKMGKKSENKEETLEPKKRVGQKAGAKNPTVITFDDIYTSIRPEGRSQIEALRSAGRGRAIQTPDEESSFGYYVGTGGNTRKTSRAEEYLKEIKEALKNKRNYTEADIYSIVTRLLKDLYKKDSSDMDVKALINAQSFVLDELHRIREKELSKAAQKHKPAPTEKFYYTATSKEDCVVLREVAKERGYDVKEFNTAVFDYFTFVGGDILYVVCLDTKERKIYWEVEQKEALSLSGLRNIVEETRRRSSTNFFHILELLGVSFSTAKALVRKSVVKGGKKGEFVVINGVECPKDLFEEIIEMRTEDLISNIIVQLDIDSYESTSEVKKG